VPKEARNTLLVRLQALEEGGNCFRLIYDSSKRHMEHSAITKEGIDVRGFKVWEIVYPKEIKPNPNFLSVDFKEPNLYHSWMKGAINLEPL